MWFNFRKELNDVPSIHIDPALGRGNSIFQGRLWRLGRQARLYSRTDPPLSLRPPTAAVLGLAGIGRREPDTPNTDGRDRSSVERCSLLSRCDRYNRLAWSDRPGVPFPGQSPHHLGPIPEEQSAQTVAMVRTSD